MTNGLLNAVALADSPGSTFLSPVACSASAMSVVGDPAGDVCGDAYRQGLPRCSGISVDRGLMDLNPEEVQIKPLPVGRATGQACLGAWPVSAAWSASAERSSSGHNRPRATASGSRSSSRIHSASSRDSTKHRERVQVGAQAAGRITMVPAPPLARPARRRARSARGTQRRRRRTDPRCGTAPRSRPRRRAPTRRIVLAEVEDRWTTGSPSRSFVMSMCCRFISLNDSTAQSRPAVMRVRYPEIAGIHTSVARMNRRGSGRAPAISQRLYWSAKRGCHLPPRRRGVDSRLHLDVAPCSEPGSAVKRV